MDERRRALELAERVLNEAADPDSDIAILARQLRRACEPLTVHLVLRKNEPVAIHASHDEAYEDRDRRTGHGERPDLDAIYHLEAWSVQDERNLSDEDHAAYVARGWIPAARARSQEGGRHD